MKIALRLCHTEAITGACGLIKETESCWNLVYKLKPVLELHGHQVLIIKGRNDLNDHDQTKEGARIANEWGADIYISFHMNASNGKGKGTEYIVYDNSNTAVREIAKNIMDFMVSLGVPYRREIINKNFWELKYTSMPATIIELLFCDNQEDVAIWNNTSWDTLVYGICNAIDSNIPRTKPEEKPSPGYWNHNGIGWSFYFHEGGYAKNQWLRLDAWYLFNEEGYAYQNEFYIDDQKRLFFFDNGCRCLPPGSTINLRAGNYCELSVQ